MFGKRLKKLRTDAGFTQQSFLQAIILALIQNGESEASAQTSLGTYRNWEQGKSIPNSRYLKVIAPLLHTTTDYLLGVSDHSERVVFRCYEAEMRSIPILDRIEEGKARFREGKIPDLAAFRIDADFALIAEEGHGNSEEVRPGDLLFVRRQYEVENGELALVLIRERVSVKRIYRYDSLCILGEDAAFDPIMFRDGEQQDLRILGKVIAHMRVYH